MGYFEKLLNNSTFSVIVSVILGIGLACIFRNSCKNGICLIHVAPHPLDNEEFMWNGNCYKYKKQIINCPMNKEIIDK